MGQQQLLLVILVVIIVGVATIVAMNVVGEGRSNANKDAIRQDLATAASNAQQIWTRPITLGGVAGNFSEGPEDQEFYGILGIPGTIGGENGDIENANAVYNVTRGEEALTISAIPKGSVGAWQMIVTKNTSEDAATPWNVKITDGEGNVYTIGDGDN